MRKNVIIFVILLGLVAYSAYDYINNRTNSDGNKQQTVQDGGATVGIKEGSKPLTLR